MPPWVPGATTGTEMADDFNSLDGDFDALLAGFNESVDDRVAALAVAGANMTITYDDGAGTLTFAASGGGGGGTGDVEGPASATDDRVAGFDGPTGKLIKQGTLTLTEIANIAAEVIAARGGRSSLGLRLNTISNFASPNVGGLVSGSYYDAAPHAAGLSSIAGAAGRMELVPYYTSVDLPITEIGAIVVTSSAGQSGRVGIYSSDSGSWPDELLFEGSVNLDYGTTGYKSHSLSFTFEAGRQYWLAHVHSSTVTLRGWSTTTAYNLGPNGASSTSYFTLIRRIVTFADPMPSTWTFSSSELTSGTVPAIRFRMA